MNAYAYLRVSGRNQIDGDGFERQLLACQSYAEQNSLAILSVFEEQGISGATELDNRPALQELYAALEASDTKIILIEKLDRLARDLMVQETIIADLKKHGYTLISVMEPDLCRDDPSRKLMRQIFGAIAEYDRAMIVLKLRGARQRMKAREGRCEGKKPYGHYDGEAANLGTIHTLRASGMYCQDIAARMNADGILTRSGGVWHAGTISKILARERVTQRCAPDTLAVA
jgi:DNA invertase Pin-like site-specific DNA recombinase